MTSNNRKTTGDYDASKKTKDYRGDCGDKAKAEDTYKIINGNQYKIINTASTSKYSIGRYTLRETRRGGGLRHQGQLSGDTQVQIRVATYLITN